MKKVVIFSTILLFSFLLFFNMLIHVFPSNKITVMVRNADALAVINELNAAYGEVNCVSSNDPEELCVWTDIPGGECQSCEPFYPAGISVKCDNIGGL